MRKALLSTAILLTFVGIGTLVACGGDDSSKFDLSTNKGDLAKVIPDLTVVGTETCEQIITCTNAAMTDAAFDACVAMGSPTGSPLFKTLIQCVDTACPFSVAGMQTDMANNACETDENGNVLDTNACNACQKATQDTGGACLTQFNNCTADQT